METEITVEVFNSLDELRNILNEKHFVKYDEFTLTDYYFSKYSLIELKNMTYKDLIKNSFLVRHIKSKNSNMCQICYKNKIIENDVVTMETKITSQLSNLKNTIEILKNAGLTLWCECVNNSVCYKNEKLSFALQMIEGLGNFIEYEEDETMNNMLPSQKIETMKNNLKEVGFKLGNDFSSKKPYLILHKKEK